MTFIRQTRTRRVIAALCVALVVIGAFVPQVAAQLGAAILVPLGLVLTSIAIASVRWAAAESDEQPVSRSTSVPPRAPPARFELA